MPRHLGGTPYGTPQGVANLHRGNHALREYPPGRATLLQTGIVSFGFASQFDSTYCPGVTPVERLKTR